MNAELALKQLVSEFLALVRDERASQTETASELERLLDALAAARHGIRYALDSTDHPDAPDWPYAARRALASLRFPNFGYYNVASPVSVSIGDGCCNVGDAIDDVADIAGDLAAVEWRWENTSEADALWHFENGFQHHWGQHLRDLQAYLHARRFGR